MKIFENIDFGGNFPKFLDFGRYVRKKSIFIKFYENLNFAEIFENLNFCRNFRNILILVEIFKNLDFCRNLQQFLILVEIFVKFRFWLKFSLNFDFG